MHLSDVELLPGRVTSIELGGLGAIKAEVPTVSSLDNVDDKEELPDVHPLTMFGQSYKEPALGSSIWVLVNRQDKLYYYLPMFDINYDTKELIENNDGAEVLFNNTKDNSKMYYSTDSGICMNVADSTLSINPKDKSINMEASGNVINMTTDGVRIGKSPTNPAVKGNELYDLFNTLKDDLMDILDVMNFPGTSHICPSLTVLINHLSENMETIKSTNVKID